MQATVVKGHEFLPTGGQQTCLLSIGRHSINPVIPLAWSQEARWRSLQANKWRGVAASLSRAAGGQGATYECWRLNAKIPIAAANRLSPTRGSPLRTGPGSSCCPSSGPGRPLAWPDTTKRSRLAEDSRGGWPGLLTAGDIAAGRSGWSTLTRGQ